MSGPDAYLHLLATYSGEDGPRRLDVLRSGIATAACSGRTEVLETLAEALSPVRHPDANFSFSFVSEVDAPRGDGAGSPSAPAATFAELRLLELAVRTRLQPGGPPVTDSDMGRRCVRWARAVQYADALELAGVANRLGTAILDASCAHKGLLVVQLESLADLVQKSRPLVADSPLRRHAGSLPAHVAHGAHAVPGRRPEHRSAAGHPIPHQPRAT
jgi:hypothetical protein